MQRKQVINNATIIIACGLLFTAIIISLFGPGKDFLNYDAFFERVRYGSYLSDTESRIEIGFFQLSSLLTSIIYSNDIVYAAMAIISLAFKLRVLSNVAATYSSFLVGILFYFFRFAPLHEMTQLRVAVAIAFLFIAFHYMIRGERLASILFASLSPLFHTSAILLTVLIIVGQTNYFHFRSLTVSKAILYSLLSFLASKLLVDFLIQYFGAENLTLAIYLSHGFGDTRPNPFSASLMLDIYTIITGIFLWSRISDSMKVALFYLILGLSLFYASIELPVIAFRLRELLSVFISFFVVQGLVIGGVVRLFAFSIFISSSIVYAYIYFVSGDFFGG